ncbi:MAG TPA: BglII/BstYI family type II restriction endonuclease [Methylocella sp.]|nr:BglII/BstYI family type II restriction endonuclease [Methylocella sp.]
MFESLSKRGFQVEFLSHAKAILSLDFPDAAAELEEALGELSIPIEEIIGSGGGEAKGTQRLRRSLAFLGWNKINFTIEKRINGVPKESISHEVDHVRQFPDGRVIALEIEWNNKDPFFDRDLENFKRLHAEGAISFGVIVTRGASLQDQIVANVRRFAIDRNLACSDDLRAIGLNPTRRQIDDVTRRVRNGTPFTDAWSASFVQDKYGAATTHWKKLEDRVRRGVGNPCPLLLIGLPSSIFTFGEHLDTEAIVSGDDSAL